MAGTSVLANLAIQISANTATFNKSLQEATRGLQSFQKTFTQVAAAVGVGFGTREVIQFALEVAKLGGEAQAVSSAFNKLGDSVELLNRLRQATKGTVSDLDLMKSTVQAANFGIEISKLPDLFQFATLRAQQTGQSIDYLVQSIVLGIGRKSPMILDNLGISLIRLREKLKGVGSESASIADMTRAVSEIMNEDLGKMAKFAENAKTSIDRLSASWNNLKKKIGETGFLNQGLREFEMFVSDLSGDAMVKAFNLLRSNDPTLGSKVPGYNQERQTRLLNKALGDLKEELIGLAIENGKFSMSQEEIAQRFNISKDNAKRFFEILQSVNQEYVKIKANQDAAAKGEVDPISGMAAGGERWMGRPKVEKTEEQLKAEEEALKQAEKSWDAYYKRITSGSDIIPPATLLMEMMIGTIRRVRQETEKPLQLPGFKKEGGLDIESSVFGINKYTESLKPLIDGLKKVQNQSLQLKDAIIEDMKNINNAFTSAAQQGIMDFLFGFEQMAGKEITFGQNILNAISNFMRSFGQQLIALGVAKLGLDKLLASLTIPNAAVAIGAIAAGTALVAAAGAIRARNDLAIQKTVRTSSNSENFNTGLRSMDSLKLEVSGTLTGSGRDLVAVINNTYYDNKVRKGG